MCGMWGLLWSPQSQSAQDPHCSLRASSVPFSTCLSLFFHSAAIQTLPDWWNKKDFLVVFQFVNLLSEILQLNNQIILKNWPWRLETIFKKFVIWYYVASNNKISKCNSLKSNSCLTDLEKVKLVNNCPKNYFYLDISKPLSVANVKPNAQCPPLLKLWISCFVTVQEKKIYNNHSAATLQ